RLAQGVRRARLRHPADHRLPPGTRARARPIAVYRIGGEPDRPDPDALGNRGTEEALHPQGAYRRGNLVPGILRTGVRFGPGLAANPRGGRWRRLRRERAEGLDFQRAVLGLDLSAGTH